MPAHGAQVDLHLSRHRAAPYAERADQADHVRRSTFQGKRCRLPAAERRKPFSGKHLLAAVGPLVAQRHISVGAARGRYFTRKKSR